MGEALVEVLGIIRDTGLNLYIHTQALDTSTPSGRAMFGMLAAFAEFDKGIIVERVRAGLERVKTELGHRGTSSLASLDGDAIGSGGHLLRRIRSNGSVKSWRRVEG
jgi:DNA invertase Pin-like site-specific DNA recombinase